MNNFKKNIILKKTKIPGYAGPKFQSPYPHINFHAHAHATHLGHQFCEDGTAPWPWTRGGWTEPPHCHRPVVSQPVHQPEGGLTRPVGQVLSVSAQQLFAGGGDNR